MILRRIIPAWAAAVSGGLVLVFFLAGLPYSTGYNNDAISLWAWVWAIANAYGGDWQHCIIVPLICGFLIWRMREDIHRCQLKPSNTGWMVVFLGMFFFWAGYVADIRYVGFFSWQVMLLGVVVSLAGWGMMRVVFFPWAFLTFMWPMPFFDNIIAFPLRILMSDMAYFFLNIIGVDTVRVGTAVVSAPTYTLPQGAKFAVDIADPCSGIRSLFALLMISSLYAYFMTSIAETFPVLRRRYPWMEKVCWFVDRWRGWILFAMAVPLAVLGNFARVLMLTFGTMMFGAEFAIGSIDHPSTFHMLAGFIVFAVALAGMVGMGWVLEKLPEWWDDRDRILKATGIGGKGSRSTSGDDF